MNRWRPAALVGVVAAVSLAGACGGDSPAADESPTSTSAPPQTTTSLASGPPATDPSVIGDCMVIYSTPVAGATTGPREVRNVVTGAIVARAEAGEDLPAGWEDDC